MTSLSVTSTSGVRRGQTVGIQGEPFRVVDVPNSTTIVLGPVPVPWHRRLWIYLTTAPNGDATEWMR